MTEMEKNAAVEKEHAEGQVAGGVTEVDLSDAGSKAVPPPAAPSSHFEELAKAQLKMNDGLSAEDISKFGDLAAGPEKVDEPEEPEEEVGPDLEEVSGFASVHTACQKCGWPADKTVAAVPTDSDKQEFIRSVLGSRRYKKTYGYFDDEVRIGMRSLLKAERELILSILTDMVDDGTISSPEDWRVRYTEAELTAVVEFVSVGGSRKDFEEMPLDKDKFKAMSKDKLEVMGEWPESIYGMVLNSQQQFNSSHSTMVARTYDPDFWKGLTDSKS